MLIAGTIGLSVLANRAQREPELRELEPGNFNQFVELESGDILALRSGDDGVSDTSAVYVFSAAGQLVRTIEVDYPAAGLAYNDGRVLLAGWDLCQEVDPQTGTVVTVYDFVTSGSNNDCAIIGGKLFVADGIEQSARTAQAGPMKFVIGQGVDATIEAQAHPSELAEFTALSGLRLGFPDEGRWAESPVPGDWWRWDCGWLGYRSACLFIDPSDWHEEVWLLDPTDLSWQQLISTDSDLFRLESTPSGHLLVIGQQALCSYDPGGDVERIDMPFMPGRGRAHLSSWSIVSSDSTQWAEIMPDGAVEVRGVPAELQGGYFLKDALQAGPYTWLARASNTYVWPEDSPVFWVGGLYLQRYAVYLPQLGRYVVASATPPPETPPPLSR
jgi:hypothetical protein